MGSAASSTVSDGKQEVQHPSFSKFSSKKLDGGSYSKKDFEKQFQVQNGELESVASGYTSFAEYQKIGVTLKRLFDRLTCKGILKTPLKADGNNHSASSDMTPQQSFLHIVVKHMPFVARLMETAPFHIVIERIICHVAGISCNVLHVETSHKMVESMSTDIDDTLSISLKGTVHDLEACVAILPLDIISVKDNYYSSSEPVLAPFIQCLEVKSRKIDFFVSLEERVEMLRNVDSFRSPEELLKGIKTISSFISDLLAGFTLRLIFHVARFIHTVSEIIEEGDDEGSTEGGEKLRKHVKHDLDDLEQYLTNICMSFEELCGDEFQRCRHHYPHVFAFRDFYIKWEEADGRPLTLAVAVNTLLKQMFLFAGGLRSISADDRFLHIKDETDALNGKALGVKKLEKNKIPELTPISSSNGNNRACDTVLMQDVCLASALHVDAISWVSIIPKLLGISSDVRDPLDTVSDAVICGNIMRSIYQHMGILPYGSFCPKSMLQWIDIFPLYTLNEEATRTLLLVYSRVAEQETRIMRPIMRSDAFGSVLRSVKNMERHIMKHNNKKRIVGDIIVPVFDSEGTTTSNNKYQRSRCGMMYDLFLERCVATTKPFVDITPHCKINIVSRLFTHLSAFTLHKVRDVLTSAWILEYAAKTGATLQWDSARHVHELRQGDVLYIVGVIEGNENGDSESPMSPNFNEDTTGSPLRGSNGTPLLFPWVREKERRNSKETVDTSQRLYDFQQRDQLQQQQQQQGKEEEGKSAEGGTEVQFHWTIAWALRVRDGEHVIVFEGDIKVPRGFKVKNLKLLGRCVPLLISPKSENVMWTNPSFPYHPDDSTLHLLPFSLGWLLGNTISNEVLFCIHLAPLVFRLIGRALNYQESFKETQTQAADLSLIYEKFVSQSTGVSKWQIKQLLECDEDVGDAENQIKVMLLGRVDSCNDAIMNISHSTKISCSFWEQVVHGFRCTAVGNSPLLKNFCSRMAQKIFCGSAPITASSTKVFTRGSFCWKDHFAFLASSQLTGLPYGSTVVDVFTKALQEHITGDDVRKMLFFITGQTQLPVTPLTECIILTFDSLSETFTHASQEKYIFDHPALKMLPTLWRGHHVLMISASLESLLIGSNGTTTLSPKRRADMWAELSAELQSEAMLSFEAALKKDLLSTVNNVNISSGEGGGGRGNFICSGAAPNIGNNDPAHVFTRENSSRAANLNERPGTKCSSHGCWNSKEKTTMMDLADILDPDHIHDHKMHRKKKTVMDNAKEALRSGSKHNLTHRRTSKDGDERAEATEHTTQNSYHSNHNNHHKHKTVKGETPGTEHAQSFMHEKQGRDLAEVPRTAQHPQSPLPRRRSKSLSITPRERHTDLRRAAEEPRPSQSLRIYGGGGKVGEAAPHKSDLEMSSIASDIVPKAPRFMLLRKSEISGDD